MRACLLAFGLFISAVARAEALLSIIIDDVGNNYELAREVIALPGPVTVSILPRLAHSRRVAEEAYRRGHEVMLHQPMASLHHNTLGPGGLTLDHTRADLRAVLAANLASVPHAMGVNNHMGSLLTVEPTSMRWFMALLREHGDLYFVDSRTNPRSIALQTARADGVPTARRDVFLDNEREPRAIARRLGEAVRLARLKGSAIAIGHPYPETLQVLRQALPRLAGQGISLRPVSHIIAYQRSPETWHASSFPLPQVAKSSKQ
ncbi:MAG: divergent polysaccharide deacetylase family protein [Gammaproteobacteria bacterium]|nr:MAG: divergent polysaccharide deacetylase family protein [Gammaproteobacteria bacterium]